MNSILSEESRTLPVTNSNCTMAKKTSGNVTDWHKQQHKKQLQKNKQARIAARDERVVQEKTVQSVRDEIHKLERQHKNVELRPHAITSKLDRLHKELKLIQANEEKVKEEKIHNSTANVSSSHARTTIDQTQNYIPLDNPAVSIYYDAHLNPYGAPPPGQPKLYHRRGGGTTSNLSEACTLAEQFTIPPPPPPPRSSIPPPPPPPPPRAAPPAAAATGAGAGSRPYTPSSSNQKPHQSVVQQPQSRQHVPHNGTRLHKSNHQNQQQGADATSSSTSSTSTTTNKTLCDPSIPPALPPPSASVQRCFKKSAVDIWASTEEVEYEAAVSSAGFALEGVITTNAATTNTGKATSAATTATVAVAVQSDETNATTWYYQDTSGAIQGPFGTLQMQGWAQAGFFPGTTKTSTHANGPWIELDHVPIFNGATNAPSVPLARDSNVTQKVAKTSTVQDRIAALRQSVQKPMEQLPEPNDIDEHDDEPLQSSSVADRIAALRQERLQEEQEEEGDNGIGAAYAGSSGGGGASSAVQDRIAALKAPGRNGSASGTDNGQSNHSVQDRIDALRAQHYSSILSEANATDDPPPLPPAPAPRQEDYLSDVAPYPVDDDDDDAAVPYLEYPLNDAGDHDVAYPIDEEDDNAGDGDDDDDDAPVTGDYDTADYYDDDGQDGDDDPSSQKLQSRYSTAMDKTDQEQQLAQPPKKKIKVNQAVVALLPSHLRKATAAATAPR